MVRSMTRGGEHSNHVADVPLNGLTLGLRTAFNFQTDDILEVTSVCDWDCLVVLVRQPIFSTLSFHSIYAFLVGYPRFWACKKCHIVNVRTQAVVVFQRDALESSLFRDLTRKGPPNVFGRKGQNQVGSARSINEFFTHVRDIVDGRQKCAAKCANCTQIWGKLEQLSHCSTSHNHGGLEPLKAPQRQTKNPRRSEGWLWYYRDSNLGHTDFQSVALPTEL